MASSLISRFFSFFYRKDSPQTTESTVEPEAFKVKVIKSKNGFVVIKISADQNGYFLKRTALELFSTSSETSDDDVSKFKLIQSRTKKVIGDFELLKDLKILNNEELLLFEKRSPVENSIDSENLAGPTDHQILEKTSLIKTASIRPQPYNINDLLLEDGKLLNSS